MIQPKEDVIHLPISEIFISLFVLNGVFAIMGNTLICFAFYRNRRLRTVANIYVLSLAIADITTATFTVPFSSISTGFGKWPFNFNFCKFQGFVCYIYAQISVNILALTAVNRYFCIVKPHLYPVFCTRTKTIVLIIFVAVLTFSAFLTATLVTPVLFEWNPFYRLQDMKSTKTFQFL